MNLRRLPGKLKGYFFVLRIDRLLPGRILQFLGNMAELSAWIARNRKCGYSDFYSHRFDYSRRYKLYEHVIQDQQLGSGVNYFEFGVAKGLSFRWWIERIKDPEARFYGFDTFSGLPEDWGPFRKGDMNNGNNPPEIEGSRHRFFQGLFQQTLIPFLNDYHSERRKVIHMDADLYSSTLYVLSLMTPFLRPGDILFFDEFNVPMHEFKAFKEWSSAFYIKYRVLGAVNNFYQIAVMIE